MLQDDLLASPVVLRVHDGIVGTGVLGDAGQDGTFGQGQLGRMLVEIPL